MTFLVDLWDDLCHGRKQKNGSPIHLLQLEHLVSWAVVVTVLHTTHWAFLYLRFLIFCDAHSQICHTSRPEPDSNPTWTRLEPDLNPTRTIVGNFLHFWSLARHKTKFQISCETCKTARLEEFPIFSVIFKFLARKCS